MYMHEVVRAGFGLVLFESFDRHTASVSGVETNTNKSHKTY